MAEAKELGVLKALLAADARTTEAWVHYDALVPTEVSLAIRRRWVSCRRTFLVR